jgi:hypothetical protein
MDASAVGDTGSGLVVRDTLPTVIGPTFLQASNAAFTNLIYGHRFTDTSPVSTGSLMKFSNAAESVDLWRVDLTGTLITGSIPLANMTGLGAALEREQLPSSANLAAAVTGRLEYRRRCSGLPWFH